jgi:hypothetical protein
MAFVCNRELRPKVQANPDRLVPPNLMNHYNIGILGC